MKRTNRLIQFASSGTRTIEAGVRLVFDIRDYPVCLLHVVNDSNGSLFVAWSPSKKSFVDDFDFISSYSDLRLDGRKTGTEYYDIIPAGNYLFILPEPETAGHPITGTVFVTAYTRFTD